MWIRTWLALALTAGSLALAGCEQHRFVNGTPAFVYPPGELRTEPYRSTPQFDKGS